MVLAEPTEVCVTLFQRNARTVLDQVDLMVAIHYEDPATHGPGELAVRSARRIQPNVRTEDVFLPAGRYIVTAFSFAKFDDKTVPGTIVIHRYSYQRIHYVTRPLQFEESVGRGVHGGSERPTAVTRLAGPQGRKGGGGTRLLSPSV